MVAHDMIEKMKEKANNQTIQDKFKSYTEIHEKKAIKIHYDNYNKKKNLPDKSEEIKVIYIFL